MSILLHKWINNGDSLARGFYRTPPRTSALVYFIPAGYPAYPLGMKIVNTSPNKLSRALSFGNFLNIIHRLGRLYQTSCQSGMNRRFVKNPLGELGLLYCAPITLARPENRGKYQDRFWGDSPRIFFLPRNILGSSGSIDLPKGSRLPMSEDRSQIPFHNEFPTKFGSIVSSPLDAVVTRPDS
jgi:hypothetical protein